MTIRIPQLNDCVLAVAPSGRETRVFVAAVMPRTNGTADVVANPISQDLPAADANALHGARLRFDASGAPGTWRWPGSELSSGRQGHTPAARQPRPGDAVEVRNVQGLSQRATVSQVLGSGRIIADYGIPGVLSTPINFDASGRETNSWRFA